MSRRIEQATQSALRFMDAVNAGNAAAAQRELAPSGKLVFPGPVTFTRVDEFLSWATARYRSATYTYAHTEGLEQGEEVVLYAQGNLQGIFNDGEAFSGVRYIDRFVFTSAGIQSKEVWSDMADLLRRLKR